MLGNNFQIPSSHTIANNSYVIFPSFMLFYERYFNELPLPTSNIFHYHSHPCPSQNLIMHLTHLPAGGGGGGRELPIYYRSWSYHHLGSNFEQNSDFSVKI